MNNKFLLDDKFYESLFLKFKSPLLLSEKELQIDLCRLLYQEFNISRVCNEPNYRYYAENKGYYSDDNTELCMHIANKGKAKRCDLRLLSTSAWIELKLNTSFSKASKQQLSIDVENLFSEKNNSFTSYEDQFSLNFWTNDNKNSELQIVDHIKKVLVDTNTLHDTELKVIQISQKMTVAIIYKLGTSSAC